MASRRPVCGHVQLDLLDSLIDAGPLTARELHDHTGAHYSTVRAGLVRMLARAWVERSHQAESPKGTPGRVPWKWKATPEGVRVHKDRTAPQAGRLRVPGVPGFRKSPSPPAF